MNSVDPLDLPYEILLPVNTHGDRRRLRARSRTRERAQSVLSLGIAVVTCLGAVALGAMPITKTSPFYLRLIQPSWALPLWLSIALWSAASVAAAVAAWIVWRRRHETNSARPALLLLTTVLVVHAVAAWSLLARHRASVALSLLLLSFVLTVAAMYRIRGLSRPACVLLTPYAAWLSFAATVVWNVWRLNPTQLR